jgi:hypothetical protein
MTSSVRLLPFLLVASTLAASAQTPASTAVWDAGPATMLFDGASLDR